MNYARAHADALLMTLAALIFVAYVAGTSITTRYGTSLVKGDGRGYFSYLPSLVLDGDIVLNNQFETLQPEGQSTYPYGEGPQGRAANPFPIAPALLWFPGYLAGLAIERAIPPLRFGNPVGYGAAAVWGAAAAAIFFAGVAAVITRRLIAQSVGERDALTAVLATWLGTAAVYYTLVTPLYSHAVAWFGVASMLYAAYYCVTRPPRPGPWLVAGLFGGYMAAIRLVDASLLALPLLLVAFRSRALLPEWRALGASVAAWGLGIALGYLPQGLASYQLYGTWSPSSPRELGAQFQSNIFFDALFSTQYEGWLSWTPIIVPALVGLVSLVSSRRVALPARHLAAAAIVGVAALYLTDVFHPYARQGAAFGARRYVSASPFVALGLAGVLDAAEARGLRRQVFLLIGALVIWNLWLLCSYELLVIVYRVYPTLQETWRFAVGLGPP